MLITDVHQKVMSWIYIPAGSISSVVPLDTCRFSSPGNAGTSLCPMKIVDSLSTCVSTSTIITGRYSAPSSRYQGIGSQLLGIPTIDYGVSTTQDLLKQSST